MKWNCGLAFLVAATMLPLDAEAGWKDSRRGRQRVRGGPVVSHEPRSFYYDGAFYDSAIRDIRLVQPSLTLPGGRIGIPETLPVLPPSEAGYFITRSR